MTILSTTLATLTSIVGRAGNSRTSNFRPLSCEEALTCTEEEIITMNRFLKEKILASEFRLFCTLRKRDQCMNLYDEIQRFHEQTENKRHIASIIHDLFLRYDSNFKVDIYVDSNLIRSITQDVKSGIIPQRGIELLEVLTIKRICELFTEFQTTSPRGRRWQDTL
ncbi:cyclic di-GMP phosphodiesterase CdpA [Acrasis kona]|uniref:Cyclic di-GMP phosphodiesterase CdpA n=1 Tax=Acrasis kona TaxID=1008807 RepID=A0AAW2Z1A0_9EUKA